MKTRPARKKHNNETRLHTVENARIFIDAYNFILQDPVLSKQPVLEQARDALRMMCGQYHESHPGHIIYLVFDGDSTVGPVSEKSKNQILNEKRGIREVFTPSCETADDWIINLAGQVFPPENLFVVTRDVELSNAVALHGAAVISPEKFFENRHRSYKRKQKQQKNKQSFLAEKNDDLSPCQVREINAELKELFADQMDEPMDFQ